MKKYLVLFTAVLFLVVGCGEKEKTPEEIFETANNNLETVENMTLKMSMDFAVEADGESQELNMSVNAKIDEKNKKTDMDITMDMGGMSFELKTYTETKDNQIITYAQDLFGDGYTKSTSTEDEAFNPNEFTDVVGTGQNIKEVESDVADMKKYEVTITKDNMKKILESTGEMTGETMEINSDMIVPVYIDNDGYIRKMVIDMTDYLAPTEDFKYTKAVMTFEFSNYNKTTVSIPDDVINNAVEESDDYFDDSDDYLDDSDEF